MIKARVLRGNVKLSPSYDNVIRFENQQQKEFYFNHIDKSNVKGKTFFDLLDDSNPINFNIGDTVNTEIVLKCDEELNIALNRNYMIVKEKIESGPFINSIFYYYYFIVGVEPLKNNTIRYILKLDVFTTFDINSDYNFENTLIERKHCDRYILDEVEEGKLHRKATINYSTEINQTEEVESIFNANFPVAKKYLNYEGKTCASDENGDSVLNNVDGWCLFFCQLLNHESGDITKPEIYKTNLEEDYTLFYKDPITENNYPVSFPYIILLAPITEMTIAWDDPENPRKTRGWSAGEVAKMISKSTFLKLISNQVIKYCPIVGVDREGERVYNEKVKKLMYKYFTTDFIWYDSIYSINEKGVHGKEHPFNCIVWKHVNLAKEEGIMKSKPIEVFDLIKDFDKEIKMIYTEEEYKNINEGRNAKKKMSREIKMLKKPFTNIISRDIVSEGKSYNIFDLKTDSLVFDFREVPNPEGVKEITSIIDGYYSLSNDLNIGDIKDNNYFLPTIDSQYADYVRNHRNHLLEGIGVPLLNVAASSFIPGSYSYDFSKLDKSSWDTSKIRYQELLKYGPKKESINRDIFSKDNSNINRISYSPSNVGRTIDSLSSILNYQCHINDLKNAPDSIRASMGDFLFSHTTNNIKNFVEIDQLVGEDKINLFEYFYNNGYKVHRYYKSEDLFNRYIFNFVQTGEDIVEKITVPSDYIVSMSYLIKKEISDALQKGVRFWESDSGHIFNLYYENYEKDILKNFRREIQEVK